MNCYRCERENIGAMSPAVGICRHCGAGICARHLIELSSKPVGGMAAMISQRLLLCMVCAREQGMNGRQRSADLSRKVRKPSSPLWWSWWFARRSQRALPTPEAVLAEVERLLQHRQPPYQG